MTTKADTHNHTTHASKPAAKDKTEGEKVIDSLGQENPAQELEKKNLAEAQEKAKEAEKEEKKAS